MNATIIPAAPWRYDGGEYVRDADGRCVARLTCLGGLARGMPVITAVKEKKVEKVPPTH